MVNCRVNPVTGYVREERPDPMADMSEEQKMYEAEKLMSAMDRLMGEGFIKPGEHFLIWIQLAVYFY